MGKQKVDSKVVGFKGPKARDINLSPQPFIQSRGRKPKEWDALSLTPIERTQSWEWREAKRSRPPRTRVYGELPVIITLSNSYFGKRLSQRRRTCAFSKQTAVTHSRPFYPAGASRTASSEKHGFRVAFARWMYQFPRMRAPVLSKPYKTPLNSQIDRFIEHIYKHNFVRVTFIFFLFTITSFVFLKTTM